MVKVEVLYGRVVSLPRKLVAGRKTPALGRVLVTRGPRAGSEVAFQAPLDLYGVLALRTLVRLSGSFGPRGVFQVASVGDAARDLQPQDVAVLVGWTGGVVDPAKVEAVLSALGSPSLARVVDLLLDPAARPSALAVIESVLGPDDGAAFAAALMRLPDKGVQEVWDLFCQAGLGLDISHAVAVVDYLRRRAARHGKTVRDVVADFPWVLGQVFPREPGIMALADRLARFLGISGPSGDVWRCIGHAIHYVQREAELKGHSYARAGAVWRLLARKGFSRAVLEAAFSSFSSSAGGYRRPGGTLVRYRKLVMPLGRVAGQKAGRLADALYLPVVYQCEDKSAERVELVLRRPGCRLDPVGLKSEMAAWLAREMPGHPPYDADQLAVADELAKRKVVVVTGLAGAGKTVMLKGLVSALKDQLGVPVPVLAPTGIAAQRAAERTGADPSTVHRFARVYEDEDLADGAAPGPDEGQEVERGYPVVVVDEMSMMTIGVFAKLVHCLVPETRYVFVGDPGQLPPIGPGGVFPALIHIGRRCAGAGLPAAWVHLRGCYRTQSGVTVNAHRVRMGLLPDPALGGVRLVFAASESEAVDKAASEIEALVRSGVQYRDIMVLAPTRTGGAGTEALNAEIARRLGAPRSFAYDGLALAPGDPVVATRNDYQWGGVPRGIRESEKKLLEKLRSRRPADRPTVFNGTRGRVLDCSPDRVDVEWYPPSGKPLQVFYLADEVRWYLEPAWAMTVHKAQGGEAEHVVVVLMEGFRRPAVAYTAMTRCRGPEVVLVVPPGAVKGVGSGGAGAASGGGDEGPGAGGEGGGSDLADLLEDPPVLWRGQRSLLAARLLRMLGVLEPEEEKEEVFA